MIPKGKSYKAINNASWTLTSMEKTKGMGKQIYLAAIQDDCCRVYYCSMTFPIAAVLDEWSFKQRSCENLGDHFKA